MSVTRLFDVDHRVGRQPMEATRPGHDAVQDREQLDLGPVAHPQGALPRLDALRGHVLEPQRAEGRQQVRPDDRAVVAERRRLAVQIVLDVPQVLVAGIGEGDAGTHHSRQDAGARLL